MQANQRVEEFKAQLKELKVKLKAAEKRAIIAEKTVKIFTKEMDKREGNNHIYIIIYILCILYIIYAYYICVSINFKFFKFVKIPIIINEKHDCLHF